MASPWEAHLASQSRQLFSLDLATSRIWRLRRDFIGRADNVGVRFAVGTALMFNVFMVVVAIIAIFVTVPKSATQTAIISADAA
jgi:hypothetical protein